MLKWKWLDGLVEKRPVEDEEEEVIELPPPVEKDHDPADLNIDTAYKTRWIWYHTILALELLLVNVLLIAILVVISVG